jgi:hypothetical protein
MKLLTLLYVFALFYVFIPGNIIKLPIKTTNLNTILIHGLLFTTILYYTISLVESASVLEAYGSCSNSNLKDCFTDRECWSANGNWDVNNQVCI